MFVADVCVSMSLLVCSMFTNNYILFCIRLAQHQLQHITITSGMLEHCGQVGASSCDNQMFTWNEFMHYKVRNITVGNRPFSVQNFMMTVHLILPVDKKAGQRPQHNEYN